jgi:hypothetical protein
MDQAKESLSELWRSGHGEPNRASTDIIAIHGVITYKHKNNSRLAWRIFIKFGMDVIPLEAIPTVYLLTFCNR